jgi:hypothetical protein
MHSCSNSKMRIQLLNLLILALPAFSTTFQPFQPAEYQLNARSPYHIFKRATCDADWSLCSSLGASEACCKPGTNCALDNANHVACCPDNAVCTGTISGGSTISGFTGNTGNTGSTTAAGGGFIVPTSGASTTSTQTGFITGNPSSTTAPAPITNQYYTYPAQPTVWANSAACIQGWQDCQADFAKCTAYLGGQAGVTISAPNGGVTVSGGGGSSVANGVGICSSLSSQACGSGTVQTCVQFGSGTSSGNAAVQGRCGPGYVMAAVGVGMGVAGQMLVL